MRTIALILTLISFTLGSIGGEATTLLIEGDVITRLARTPQRPEMVTENQHFTMYTDGLRWTVSIRNNPGFGRADDARTATEFAYDGEILRQLTQFRRDPDKQGAENAQGRLWISGLLDIYAGTEIPSQTERPAGLLWLLFASKDYFLTNKADRIPDILTRTPPSHRHPDPVPFEVKLSGSELWPVPTNFHIKNEGFTWVKKENGPFTKITNKPPFDSGYIQSSLIVKSLKNVTEKLVIPDTTEVNYFGPTTSSQIEDLMPHATVLITVKTATSVAEPHGFEYLPSGPISVNEHRVLLKNGKPLNYVAPEGIILSPGSPDMKRIIEQEERKINARPGFWNVK